jgi:hypothetical protein
VLQPQTARGNQGKKMKCASRRPQDIWNNSTQKIIHIPAHMLAVGRINRYFWQLTFTSCLFAVGGCNVFSRPVPAPPPAEVVTVIAPTPIVAPIPEAPPSDLEMLIQYYAGLRRLTPAALAKEQDNLRQQLGTAPTAHNRMQMALVLSMPNNPNRDYGRALSVLDPIAKEAGNTPSNGSGLPHFALILQGMILDNRRLEAENKRLDETLQNTNLKLKDEQRQSELLQQKLDQLKSIEKGLLERNLPKPPATQSLAPQSSNLIP